ncbi:MAG: FAD-dependent oxidoreductase, partial [Pseudonocardia sp.]|nr:FAD-dependent oxidoreductase [Pseudonocardia sp.]
LAPGGQLVNVGEVVGYPGLPDKTTGPDLAGVLLDAAMGVGVDVGYGEVTGLTAGRPATLETPDGRVTARAVVVATGLTPGRVDVPGAEHWVGRGLSECASCDGPLFADQRVAVLGDDEWAAAEAAELAGFAGQVTVLVPGTPRWSAAGAERLAAAAVAVRTGVTVTALSGGEALEAVSLADGTEFAVTGVFSYLGKTPRAALLDGPAEAPGVFLAGDVRPGADHYLVSAAADGLRAGLAAAEFLREEW